jgi:exopolysaccharide production protein ExoQ
MRTLSRYLPAYAILSVAAVLIVPVAALEPLWLTIIAGLAALAAIIENASRGEWPRPRRTLTGLLVALIVWAAASSFWSIVPDRSASQAFELFLFAAGLTVLLSTALNLDAPGRRSIETFLMIGFAIGLLFVLFELATSGFVHAALNGFLASDDTELTRAMTLFNLNRASSVMSIAVWVVIIPVWWRFGWISAILLVLVTGFAISQLQPGSPFLAIVAGAGIFAIAWFVPRVAVMVLLAAIAVGLLMIPFIPDIQPLLTDLIRSLGLSEFSLHHRMAIWQFASEHSLAQPFAGWGLDSSRLIGVGQVAIVNDAPNFKFRNVDVLPLHPHNALIQAWLELGIVGALILAALFASVVLAIRRHIRGHLERAAVYAAFTAAFINAELSFGIWQGWWLSCLALVAVLLTALAMPARSGDRPGPA